MELNILEIKGYSFDSYTVEGNQIDFNIPPEFWVIDISVSPSFKLAGPFYSLQEAQKCKARIEVEYQRLLEMEEFNLCAFKAFIKEENIKRENTIRRTYEATLENYTPRPTAAGMGNEFNM